MPANASDSADAAPGAAEDMATDPLALANQLCFSLSVASRMVVQSYRPVLEPLGLTHPQYLVMLALWGSAPRTVKDLGEQLRQDPATLSPLLKRLEARGYVTRGRDPQNERALAVSLTRGGSGPAGARPGGPPAHDGTSAHHREPGARPQRADAPVDRQRPGPRSGPPA